MDTKYVVITPARDEAEHLERTILSMAGQTILPTSWIIVNDGSRDNTEAIARKYAVQHDWIRVISLPDRGHRKPGGGVVDAFNAGFATLPCSDWEFIAKLDGDLSFDPDYFEQLLARFRANPQLGIAGGCLYHIVAGIPEVEECPRFHVRGATKVYRDSCWRAIGGLLSAPGWDAIDEVKANMLGWTTETFPEIRILHHRFTGAAQGSWRDSLKNGRADYVAGYHPLFMAAKCIRRIAKKPYIVQAVGLGIGFLSGYWRKVPQVNDRALISYVRSQQMRRLFGGATMWK
jgi:glycosyltransferase involved in cell wall biosynthesis